MGPALTLEVEQQDPKGACVVRATGELDLATAPELREALVSVISGGCLDITIDAAGLTFIDSTGIGVLVGARNRMQNLDGSLVMVNVRSQIEKTLTITGVARFLLRDDAQA